MDFLVKRDDLRQIRFAETEQAEPARGEALLAVRSFGLTANNVSYAVLGDAMSYWDFFPAPEGWGRIPVWGFADVVESRSDLAEGTRVYGYLSPSSHLVVRPDRLDDHGFVDALPHRSPLPAVYNRYLDTTQDALYDPETEDQQILLRPLFLTSFLIDDLLADNGYFGADAVILSSASSKTALSAAFMLSRRGEVDLIGLTSPGRREFVAGTGIYSRVLGYDELDALPEGRVAYVDISGDATVRDGVHRRYADRLVHSAMVGATHWDRMAGAADELPGPTPTLFFAPDRLRVRRDDWGPERFGARVAEAWSPFVAWAGGWLEVVHGRGPDAVEGAYRELLDGRVGSATGHVLSLDGEAS